MMPNRFRSTVRTRTTMLSVVTSAAASSPVARSASPVPQLRNLAANPANKPAVIAHRRRMVLRSTVQMLADPEGSR